MASITLSAYGEPQSQLNAVEERFDQVHGSR